MRIPAAALPAWVRGLLEGAGLEAGAAGTVAEALVETSLRGVDSHGIARVPVYADRLRAGGINPRPVPRVVRSSGSVALVDGDGGPGQVAGRFAMDRALELAADGGVGVACVFASNHFGAAATYVLRAARAGCVGMAMTNADVLVVPYGGAAPALGTNPIAFAAPLPDGGVFELDMATSQVAMNRVFNARDEGRAIPSDWAVDADGAATTDPGAAAAGVPLGGYKGYALALMVEVLCGVLAGAAVGRDVGRLYGADAEGQRAGHFLLALDPERLVGRERFETLLAGLLSDVRSVPVAPGADEVLVPGEPEARARAERERDGVPVEPELWGTLRALGDQLGVSAPPTV